MRNVVNLMQRPPPRFGRHGPGRVLPMTAEYEDGFRARDEYAASSPLPLGALGTLRVCACAFCAFFCTWARGRACLRGLGLQ